MLRTLPSIDELLSGRVRTRGRVHSLQVLSACALNCQKCARQLPTNQTTQLDRDKRLGDFCVCVIVVCVKKCERSGEGVCKMVMA